ncbi:MAG: cell division protein FtsA [Spirochaetes bacterium]|nr:cell division protein FtsA [Spirochaetota bacterium]
MMMGKPKIIAACDIGSSKICTLIGKYDDQEDSISIVGIGEDESKGIKKGVIVNIEATTKSIKKSTEEAEIMSGIEVDSLIVNIGGDHLFGINSKGVVAITGKNNEVSEDDIVRVIEAARTIVVPKGREIIHVLEQEYIVDNQDAIKNPLGMSGVRLEGSCHLVTGSSALIKNLKSAIARANYNINDLVISSIASAEACLMEDEKELGVLLVDIGAETTDIICFYNGSVYHTSVIPMGSFNITKDIAILLKVPIKEAEKIKIFAGYANSDDIDETEKFELPQIGASPARLEKRKYLSQIIEERLKDIFSLVVDQIINNNLKDYITAGIVITGGGSKIKGLESFCNKFLNYPVRLGKPVGFKTVDNRVYDPQYSVAYGLLKLVKFDKEDYKKEENGGILKSLKKFMDFFKS